MGEPILDVVAHAPVYMVRCSNCGVVAGQLNPKEAAEVRDNHRCPDTDHPGRDGAAD